MINHIDNIPTVEALLPPIKLKTIYDEYYLIFASKWFQCTAEVYEQVTVDLLHSKWKKKYKTNNTIFTTEVKSNSSDKTYKVTFNKYWTCECKAYQFRKSCSHIDVAKNIQLAEKNEL